MFCIAAFIVLVIISIFSASHRKLLRKAWGCVARRVTLRPCDSSFKEDVKNGILAKVAARYPKLVRATDIAIEVAAFVFVVLTVWSLLVVIKSGLNLYVYGTCNPSNASSCSLGSESCSIESAKPSFWTSVKTAKVHSWVASEVGMFVDTVQAIPTRLQDWKAEEYLPANATYARPYDASKPTALEIIDPGCQFCKQLYINSEQANLKDRVNLTYIVFPIPSDSTDNGYKFANSYVISTYLEAIRLTPLDVAEVSADWRILGRIFTEKNEQDIEYQTAFNMFYNEAQTRDVLNSWLEEFGYSKEQAKSIAELANSPQVADQIRANQQIVRERIKTVKIPTLILDGKRLDGAQPVSALE